MNKFLPLNRLEVIQALIDCKRAKTYLEIGVECGDVFLKVKAGKKIAVDPKISISKKSRFRSILKNISNISNQYYEMTSDVFFETKANFFRSSLDVVFIDGLHTYGQSLKDVENCLKLLNEDGVIIMHDCNPLSESVAYPANSWEHAESLKLDGWTGAWSGDVWKTIAYLRSTQEKLHIVVLDCDYGLGIITKGIPENMLKFSKEEIEKLSYDDLGKNRSQILNLKSTDYFKEIIGSLKAS